MIYKFLKWLIRKVLWVFFRKIFFSDQHHISLDKPLILACNHPNSFMDAVLLGVLIDKPIYFLTRSDVFNAPWKKWVLGKLHLIPIYRQEEGVENLHKNQDTFAQCYEILKNKGIVLIFSEGLCILEKRLRPLRKGTARLAFGAESANDFNLNLEVVPIGINYTHPTQFRKEVMIGIGKPIRVQDYQTLVKDNPAKAIKAFNNCLESRLRENMVIVEEPQQDQLAEELFNKSRLNSPVFYSSAWISSSREPLETEKRIGVSLAENKVGQPESEVDYGLQTKKINLPQANILLLILGFPIFILGYILNILPLLAARKITQNKVKVIEFYASVLMVLGLLMFLVYWPLFSILLASIFNISLPIWIILLPLTGFIALKWYDNFVLFKLANK